MGRGGREKRKTQKDRLHFFPRSVVTRTSGLKILYPAERRRESRVGSDGRIICRVLSLPINKIPIACKILKKITLTRIQGSNRKWEIEDKRKYSKWWKSRERGKKRRGFLRREKTRFVDAAWKQTVQPDLVQPFWISIRCFAFHVMPRNSWTKANQGPEVRDGSVNNTDT